MGAQELALDGAGGRLLAVGDLGVAKADGLQREVVALVASERLEALPGVEAVGDLVGQLGAGAAGSGSSPAGWSQGENRGGLLALAAARTGCRRRAAATRALAGPRGPGAGALGRGAAELKLPVG